MLISSTAMRALEQRAFAAGVSADALMEEAGWGIARVVRQFYPWPGLCIAVFGKGNNGGDALVAVRHLAEAGWEIRLLPAFPQSDWAPPVVEKYRAIGSPAVVSPTILQEAARQAQGRPLIVLDGLLGTGSSGALRDAVAQMTRGINVLRAGSHAQVVALDLPSGLNGDTGSVAEDAVVADLTVTIGFPKTGLVADAASAVVGRLAVVPLIGLELDASAIAANAASLSTGKSLATVLPRRSFDAHKGDCGRVGIVAGTRGTLGAAVLAATACLHGGAGLVTLYARPEAAAALSTMCPPEVMVQSIEAYGEMLGKRHDVLAVGPGLGLAEAKEVRDLIVKFPGPMVVDADGLNAMAQDVESLSWVAGDRVLTPHPGEMERLWPGALRRGRRSAAEALANRFPRCTVLLKGSRTVIAQAGATTAFNSTGTPGMAVGGMGDSLTGVIAALLGQKVGLRDAARLSAWLCGRAAELALVHGGESEETLTPTALVRQLGRAFREVRTGCY